MSLETKIKERIAVLDMKLERPNKTIDELKWVLGLVDEHFLKLQKLLDEKPVFFLFRTDDKETIINAFKDTIKWIDKLEKELKP